MCTSVRLGSHMHGVFFSILFFCLSVILTADRVIDNMLEAETKRWEYDDEVINFNKKARNRCSPIEACKDVDISTIPYIYGHVEPKFATDNNFFDMKKTRECLKNKYVLMLGDSTMGELFHDLAIILAGAARNFTLMDDYVYEATTNKHQLEHSLWNYSIADDTLVQFYCCRRNLTIQEKTDDIFIHFRYTGHVELTENYGGVNTFLDPRFHDELLCLLGLVKHCRKPDLILLNSGLHDRDYTNIQFRRELSRFVRFLKDSYKKSQKKMPKVIWKGNFIGCTNSKFLVYNTTLQVLNKEALDVVTKAGIPFVNISVVLDYVHRWKMHRAKSFYTSDCIHYGTTARSGREGLNHHGTVSMLITQTLLHEMCKM